MNTQTSFLIRLAGVTIKIQTSDETQKKRMKDYVAEEPAVPAFTVQATEKERAETLRSLRLSNGENLRCSDSYLEFLAIHGLIAEGLLDHDVLLMHGSCLSFDGEGYIFTAKSGTGKSTHARLWREVYGDRVTMVNDDKPMLKCTEKGIVAYGTPWNGKERLGENTEVRVKAIAYLERAEENSITPVKPEEVFKELYIQTYRSKNMIREMKAMELLSRICSNVRMYRLRVNMDPEAARAACKGMTE